MSRFLLGMLTATTAFAWGVYLVISMPVEKLHQGSFEIEGVVTRLIHFNIICLFFGVIFVPGEATQKAWNFGFHTHNGRSVVP